MASDIPKSNNRALVSQYIGAIEQSGHVYWAVDTPVQDALKELIQCGMLVFAGKQGILAKYVRGPKYTPDYVSPNEHRDEWRQWQRNDNPQASQDA